MSRIPISLRYQLINLGINVDELERHLDPSEKQLVRYRAEWEKQQEAWLESDNAAPLYGLSRAYGSEDGYDQKMVPMKVGGSGNSSSSGFIPYTSSHG